MAAGSKERADQLRLGFLTAVDLRDSGFVGGLLVTDRFGRPLEFQCTTPVRPNRTQQLLYGPTLKPFILGELLGKALINRVGIKPGLLFTPEPLMLSLRPLIETPLLCLATRETLPGGDETNADATATVRVGRQAFFVHEDYASDVALAERLAEPLTRDADLSEPLERVTEALRETMTTVAARPRVA